MEKKALIIGILCLAVAIVILVFADPPRQWYAGGFFAVLGTVIIGNADRRRQAAKEQTREE